MMSLKDKIAVVTGAASGIGRATVQALAEAGANVVLADIDRENGEAAAAALRQQGHSADFIDVDMTDATLRLVAAALPQRLVRELCAAEAGAGAGA